MEGHSAPRLLGLDAPALRIAGVAAGEGRTLAGRPFESAETRHRPLTRDCHCTGRALNALAGVASTETLLGDMFLFYFCIFPSLSYPFWSRSEAQRRLSCGSPGLGAHPTALVRFRHAPRSTVVLILDSPKPRRNRASQKKDEDRNEAHAEQEGRHSRIPPFPALLSLSPRAHALSPAPYPAQCRKQAKRALAPAARRRAPARAMPTTRARMCCRPWCVRGSRWPSLLVLQLTSAPPTSRSSPTPSKTGSGR